MRKDKTRELSRSKFERETKFKRQGSEKNASSNWKRFLESEDFDD